MGSEQSSHADRSQGARRAGGKTRDHNRPRSSSPRPSISSDSDIPYISYTVNQPIGDSPKLPTKSPAHSLRASANTPSPRSSPKAPRPKSYAGSTSGHDIVVVKEGAPCMDTLETDSELIKLRNIPTFHPIMRGALNIPTVRDPEVLDKLDHQAVLQLCHRYQEHLRHCTEVVSSEQNVLASRIREDSDENEKDTFYSQLQDILNSVNKGDISLVLGDFNAKVGTDSDLWAGVLGPFGIGSSNGNGERLLQIDFAIATLMSILTERQKKFTKYAEQLGKVQEISSTLKRCQMGLTEIIESMDSLNSMLPPEDRLEPFVMVTG